MDACVKTGQLQQQQLLAVRIDRLPAALLATLLAVLGPILQRIRSMDDFVRIEMYVLIASRPQVKQLLAARAADQPLVAPAPTLRLVPWMGDCVKIGRLVQEGRLRTRPRNKQRLVDQAVQTPVVLLAAPDLTPRRVPLMGGCAKTDRLAMLHIKQVLVDPINQLPAVLLAMPAQILQRIRLTADFVRIEMQVLAYSPCKVAAQRELKAERHLAVLLVNHPLVGVVLMLQRVLLMDVCTKTGQLVRVVRIVRLLAVLLVLPLAVLAPISRKIRLMGDYARIELLVLVSIPCRKTSPHAAKVKEQIKNPLVKQLRVVQIVTQNVAQIANQLHLPRVADRQIN